MGLNDGGVFVTQKANKRRAGHAHQDAVDADQLEEMVAGVAQTSQSTLLLKKKKEMREVSPSADSGSDKGVDDALELMKDEYNTRMDNCDQRQAEFEQKQMDMREQVVKFEKFIQENDAKRVRAEAKAKQERRILDQQAAELRKLEKELSHANEEEAKLEGQQARLKRYEDYLKGSSPAADPEADEINDLLNRFRTLRGANFDLMKLCADHDTSYERGRSEIQQYRQDKQNEVLVTNSLLNEKQMELEQIRGAVKRGEHESEQEGERVKGVCRESGQVMLAINNLHTRCKQTMRSRIPDMNEKELEKMAFLQRCLHCLHVVGERIEDLSEIQGGYGGSWGLANTVVPSSHSVINSNANVSSTNLRDNDHDGGGGGGGRGPRGSTTRAAAVAAASVKNNGGSRISPGKGR